MVLGDKEDRCHNCGGWGEWEVGSGGIKLWLRNDLVRVLVRPSTAGDGRLHWWTY